MKQKSQQSINGFSIVEILVVSGLSVMLMLTISSMFMTFLVGNTTANMRKAINAEGNYAVNQMSFMIRNAVGIKSPCTGSSMSSLELTSIDNSDTEFELKTNKIASSSARHLIPGNSLFLTSSEVQASGLTFTCTDAGNVKQVVFSFNLKYNGSTTEDSFTSQVLVRN